MVFSLAHGNEVNLVVCLGMGDYNNHHAQQSCGVKALLAMVITFVFKRRRWAIEDALPVLKIKPMFF